MLADPFCMGPVPDVDTETFLDLRSQFISQAFEIPIDAARERIHSEHQRLSSMADASSVVLWCEADPYDQLFLIYVLANAEPRPRQFEIIEIDRMPGVRRFVGIGQLAPSVLAWLWTKRRVLNDRAITLARKAWDAYRAPGPQAWVEIAHQDNDLLPFLAPAMRRQLQELPSSRDGLSLTERLTLQAVRDGQAMTLGKAFGVLTMHSEPLPSLGDLMFYALIRPLIEGANPLLRVWDSGANWERRPVELTELGYSVLNGEAYWLDYADQTRWVGGMCVMPGKPHWALDDSLVPVWRE